MATRCRMPPESWAGLAFSKPCNPTSSIRPSIRPGSGLIPATSSGTRMLEVTVRHGSRAASWKAMPSWCARRISPVDIPLISAVPPVGDSRPARIRRMVDLPHPEGPSSDRKEPFAVPRSVACRALTDVRPMLKVLLSPWMFRPVAASGSWAGSWVAIGAAAPAGTAAPAGAHLTVGRRPRLAHLITRAAQCSGRRSPTAVVAILSFLLCSAIPSRRLPAAPVLSNSLASTSS